MVIHIPTPKLTKVDFHCGKTSTYLAYSSSPGGLKTVMYGRCTVLNKSQWKTSHSSIAFRPVITVQKHIRFV